MISQPMNFSFRASLYPAWEESTERRPREHTGLRGLTTPAAGAAVARICILLCHKETIRFMYTVTKRERAFTLAGIMVALFLGALDQTIVATAMPRILQDLNG